MPHDHASLRLLFASHPQVRGKPIDIHPSFWEKVKLLFDKNFQVNMGGIAVKATFRGRAKAIFSKAFQIKKVGAILGRGMHEKQLELAGYTKKELAKLVEAGIMYKTTVYDQGWRNTYVLLDSTQGEQSK